MDKVQQGSVEIKLTKDKTAIVDTADAERVLQYKWCTASRKYIDYAVAKVNGTNVLMHRFILNVPRGMETDHVNGNGLDNRKENLRICTHKENVRNKRKVGNGVQSIFKGVRRVKQRWRARVAIEGKEYQKLCDTELEAALAYDEMARQHFGEFARTNFP